MTGSVVSINVMVWAQVSLLPHSSVAVHVRVMTDSPAQVPAATLSLSVTVGLVSQLSVAVAEPLAAEASLSAQRLLGNQRVRARASRVHLVIDQMMQL